MSDSDEDQKLIQVTLQKKKQYGYIKIECSRSNTVPIITALIYVKHAAMMQRTIAQRLNGSNDYRKVEDRWKMIRALVTPLSLLTTL